MDRPQPACLATATSLVATRADRRTTSGCPLVSGRACAGGQTDVCSDRIACRCDKLPSIKDKERLVQQPVRFSLPQSCCQWPNLAGLPVCWLLSLLSLSDTADVNVHKVPEGIDDLDAVLLTDILPTAWCAMHTSIEATAPGSQDLDAWIF